jgi:hypothetical protein
MKQLTLFILITLSFQIKLIAQPPLQNPISIRFSANPSYPSPAPSCTTITNVGLGLCYSTLPNDSCSSIAAVCSLFYKSTPTPYSSTHIPTLDPGLPATGIYVCTSVLQIEFSSGYTWFQSIADADWANSSWIYFTDPISGCKYQIYHTYASPGSVREYTIWPRP